MTERERWIVYPLLFLALGSALRDKLFDRTLSKSIVCEELLVLAGDSVGNGPSRILARIGPAEESRFAEGISAVAVSADNYFYRGMSFAPNLLRAVPGLLPADWLRALQERAATLEAQPGSGESPPQPSVPPSQPREPAGESN